VSLAPLVHPAIRGVEGKRHPVAQVCVAPGCISLSQEGHHMWSRGALRGEPTEWVRLPSGRVVSNVVGVCRRHHGMLTGGIGGHMAAIQLEPDETFIWLEPIAGGWMNIGQLFPQPFSETPVEPHTEEAPAHNDLAVGQTCESCGYTRPAKRDALPKRPTKTYTMVVPDDAEIGGEVIDEWVEQLAVILGFGDDVTQRLVRYHTITAALAWVMMNRQQFIEDITEVAAS
jgi:hypothetical protein